MRCSGGWSAEKEEVGGDVLAMFYKYFTVALIRVAHICYSFHCTGLWYNCVDKCGTNQIQVKVFECFHCNCQGYKLGREVFDELLRGSVNIIII